MKTKVINAATCDARNVTEESLAEFDRIVINAAILLVGERSKELLNKYPVTQNVATVLELPDGENFSMQSVNGKHEIGPDADGNGVFLMVNGKLLIREDSLDAVKSYYRILVNGKVLCPRSMRGQITNMQINGKTEYYPDGAVILKADTEIDDLFIQRASGTVYYSSGALYFLDDKMPAQTLLEKGMRFSARKVIISESLLKQLIPLFDEETELVRVPDGTKHIDDDVELKPKTIRKYGTKLCVSGDVTILDEEALSALEYLFVDGTVRVAIDLEERFEALDSVYDALKIIDPEQGLLTDRPLLKVGPAILSRYPHGVRIEDCAKVTLSKDLTQEDILNHLKIEDCAMVVCTQEQEDAVNLIAEDVALIKVSDRKPDDAGGDEDDGDENEGPLGMLGSMFGKLKNTQVINASEYVM